MLEKWPSEGNKVSMVANKVSVARVLAVQLVESRYALQGMNKDQENSEGVEQG